MHAAGVWLVLVLVLLDPCRSSVQAASHRQQQTPLVGAGTILIISRRLLTAADVQRAAALEPDTAAVPNVGSGPVPTSAGAATAKLKALKKRNKSSRGSSNKPHWRLPGQHVAAAAAAAAEPKRAHATDWIAGLTGPTAVIAAPTAGSVLSAPTPEGVTVVFDASRSQAEAGGSISSFRWAITGPGDRQRVLVAQGPTASLLLPPGSAYTARLTVTSPAGQSSSDTVAFAVVTAAAAAAGGEAAAGLGTASPAAAVLQPTPVAAAVPGATDVLPSPAVITPTDTAAAAVPAPAPAPAAAAQQPVPVAVDPGVAAPLTQPAAEPIPAPAAPVAPALVEPLPVVPVPLVQPTPPPPPPPEPSPPAAALAPTPLEPKVDNKFCNPAGDYDIIHSATDWDDMSLCCKDAQAANVVVAACSTLPPRPV